MTANSAVQHITDNDPNQGMARKKLSMTFMCWGYSLTVEATVGGNCSGMANLDAALMQIHSKLPEDTWGTPYIVLLDKAGDELQCGDEDGRGDDWLMDMLVSASVISIEPDAPATTTAAPTVRAGQ